MKKTTTSTQLIVGKNIAYFQHHRQELKNEAYCDLQNYQDYHTKHNRPLTTQEINQHQTQIKDFLDAYDKALEIYEKLDLNAIRSYVPLTKTGFLPKNKSIYIWDSNVRYPFPERYSGTFTLQIVLYPIPDDLEQGINHGELSIVLTSKQKTGIPILDKNGNPQTSTVTRTKYLKQNNVLPGYVYKQKTGPDILYLGQFTVTQYYNPYHGIAPAADTYSKNNSNAFPKHYVYVKINDVTKALLAKSKDIPDFLTRYNHYYFQNRQSGACNIRLTTTPKKFTKQLKQLLPEAKQDFTLYYQLVESNDPTIYNIKDIFKII